MNLHDPSRPRLANRLPVFLNEGSHIPAVSVMPLAGGTTVELRVMLRNYNAGSGFNYTYYKIISNLDSIPAFFRHYYENPEEALRLYFNWEDKKTSNASQAHVVEPTLKPGHKSVVGMFG